MLDLDRFKHVNDTLGHHAGDSLIREFSDSAGALLGERDTVARLGGDEFAIVHVAGAGRRARSGCASASSPWSSSLTTFWRHQVFVGASIGLVLAPDGAPTASSCCARPTSRSTAPRRRAGTASGSLRRRWTRPSSARGPSRRSFAARSRRRRASMCTTSRRSQRVARSIGVEALIRWRHPTRGIDPARASSSRSRRKPG